MIINIDEEHIWPEYRSRVEKGTDPAPDDWVAQKIRTEIIHRNLHLASLVASSMKKKMPDHVELDDLISHAHIGLLQAVQRYDLSKGVPFPAFANLRMRSVIMDAVRDADWAPRSLRRKRRAIDKAEDEFRRSGKEPSQEEIADHLGTSVQDVSDVKYQAEIAAHTFIEGNVEAQNMPAPADHDEHALVEVLKYALAKALQAMPVRKATIIALHYFSEMKLFEIADELRVSNVRVGMLHEEAVLELWQNMQSVLAANV